MMHLIYMQITTPNSVTRQLNNSNTVTTLDFFCVLCVTGISTFFTL